jgi:ribosomal protein L11 methyltransferase
LNKVFCSVDERFVNPLFEVFDGGDFILSSYHDIESDRTEMAIYFEDANQASAARTALQNALDVIGCEDKVEEGEIPDEDWKFAYRHHFKTEKVSDRIYTHPPWEPMPEATDGEIVLTLDPGMAFGTGKHETTKACLQYIDQLAAAQPLNFPTSQLPNSFLDMGCGSGILSIAAAKFGFEPVCGFDIDEDAVSASKENAAANGVTVAYRTFALGKGAVTLDASIEAAKGIYPDLALQPNSSENQGTPVMPNEPAFQPADVVVANILGPLLIAFADEIAGYAKKTLIVSGILEELYPEVRAAFAARGFREVSRKTIGEWTTGLLVRI